MWPVRMIVTLSLAKPKLTQLFSLHTGYEVCEYHQSSYLYRKAVQLVAQLGTRPGQSRLVPTLTFYTNHLK